MSETAYRVVGLDYVDPFTTQPLGDRHVFTVGDDLTDDYAIRLLFAATTDGWFRQLSAYYRTLTSRTYSSNRRYVEVTYDTADLVTDLGWMRLPGEIAVSALHVEAEITP